MVSIQKLLTTLIAAIGLLISVSLPISAQVTNPQTGSIGLEGTVPTDPPQTGATISFPTNGQVFTEIPITVSGICPAELLVKVFKNEVFAGSVVCTGQGTFEIQIDLFSGENRLVARVFDSLDQPGPDSNTVTVRYNDSAAGDGVEQLILTSNYALRGADAGTTLRWPLAISGGVRPYAIVVDWGDGETSQVALDQAGNFNVEHVYAEPGVYQVIIKATDSRGDSAFLQLTAVANGPATQDNAASLTGDTGLSGRFIIPLWPIYLMFFFIISTFWLGRRYEIRRIKDAVRSGRAVKF